MNPAVLSCARRRRAVRPAARRRARAASSSPCRAGSTARSSPRSPPPAGAEVIGITLQLYDYGAATGRKGACCAGDDIRDARAVADRLGIAHYVFDHESRVPRGSGRALRRRLPRRAHADPLHPLQHGAQVHRPAAHGARARRRLPRHRALRAAGRRAPAGPSCTARSIRRATSPISSTRRPRSSSISCASRSAACPSRRCARIAEGFGLRGRGQARQPGHLLRARRRLRARSSARCGPTARGPGAIVHAETGEALGEHRGRDPLYRRPAPRARDRRPGRAALRRRARCRGGRGPGRPEAPAGGRAPRGSPRPTASARCPTLPLTAKVRSMAKPVPVTLEGPLGGGAASDDPLRRARIRRRARARRRCFMPASGWSAAAGSRATEPPP